MSVTLEMKFLNAEGRKVTISVPDPLDTLTDAEVKTAMENILAKNVFTSSGGDLAAIDSARIVDRQITELAVV
ncbi:MAG: DUF2922 domain-containing protein [Desulfotomaculum sp.]|nr:DUF2922 domain-containing protein [Desulfotomaculum sp.]